MRSLEPFDYFEPENVHEASEMLSARGEKAWILAGGIDLIPRIRKGVLKADHVINIQKIQHLNSPLIVSRNDLAKTRLKMRPHMYLPRLLIPYFN